MELNNFLYREKNQTNKKYKINLIIASILKSVSKYKGKNPFIKERKITSRKWVEYYLGF